MQYKVRNIVSPESFSRAQLEGEAMDLIKFHGSLNPKFLSARLLSI